MAKQKTSGKTTVPVTPVRELDKLFTDYSAHYQNPTNRLIQFIFVPLFCFGVFSLVWSLPFPRIEFIGRYNGYINWASFLLAVGIYYYYKLAPVLSYFILFTLFGFSYFIIQLEQWQKTGGPALWQVSLIIAIVALAAIFTGQSFEKKKAGISQKLQFLLTGPVYIWHLILNKVNVKF